MFLKKLLLTNFLWIENRTVDFTRMTAIFGRNGSGKTSVLEGIVYALYGTIYGTNQLDTAVHNGKDFMQATLHFDHGGSSYIVDRRRPLEGGYTTITINGKESKQEEINTLLGDATQFRSGVSVGDFMRYELDDKFNLLNNAIAGNATQIYTDMVGNAIAGRYPYGSVTFKQIDDQIKEINKQINLTTVKRSEIAARLAEIGTPVLSVSTVTLELIAQAKQNIDEHNKLRPVFEEKLSDNDLRKQINIDIMSIENELKKLVAPDKTELLNLKARFDMLNEQKNAVQHASVCQACMRPFEKEDIEKEVSRIEGDMNGISQTAGSLKKEYQANFEAYTIGTTNLTKALEEKKKAREDLEVSSRTGNSTAIAEFNVKLSQWQQDHDKLVAEHTTLNEKYRQEQSAIQEYNNMSDRIKSLQNEDAELVKGLSWHNLGELETVAEALSPKGVVYKEVEQKIAEIRKYFPDGFTIELLKKNKTNDNFTKVFQVSLDGVPYQWLSKGMKKVIDIRFANLLSEKYDYGLLIVDDLESMTSLIAPSEKINQVITMCVKDEDFRITNS